MEMVQEQKIEKQIGCMSGFLHIFDCQQILAGKRVHSTKRLPPATECPSPEPVTTDVSPAFSRELQKPESQKPFVVPESSCLFYPSPPKSPMFELKNGTHKSSSKFCKEIPRLSHNRASVHSKGSLCPRENKPIADGDDKNRPSPSVIAKLMGLEPLPFHHRSSAPETVTKLEPQRSASESSSSRDPFHSRLIDRNNFLVKQPNQSHKTKICKNNSVKGNGISPQQREKRFNSEDSFPEQNQMASLQDSGKKLKMRGMGEGSKDLETLKQILEALQLKGLLHLKRPSNTYSQRNMVYDQDSASDESKIVGRYGGKSFPSIRARKSASPNQIDSRLKSCNSIVKKKPLSIETKSRVNDFSNSRRISPTNSPKLTQKRSESDPHSITYRSPGNQKPTDTICSRRKMSKSIVTEDEYSSISESTGSTSPTNKEGHREGRSLLQRCDKLLHSIAEINSTTESPPCSTTVLPSPVSVLDSEFDKDKLSSPLPDMKRSINFTVGAVCKSPDPAFDFEGEIWSPAISLANSTKHDEFISNDFDFMYISEFLKASQYIREDLNIVFSPEKHQYPNENHASNNVSELQRKLVFDTVVEILDRNRELPPWTVATFTFTDTRTSLKQIWFEFQQIRERETADDLLELICGILKRDLAGTNGWGDQPVETSEAVLDIARLIFKDLVIETIGDLNLPGKAR